MPWTDLGNPLRSSVSFPYRLSQRDLLLQHSFVSKRSASIAVPVGACGSALGELHIFDLKPAETVLWPLLAVLYPENWVIIWVDDWTYYCGQMSLPSSWTPISTSPKYLHEEIKKYSALGKNILPVGRCCFLKNISAWDLVLLSSS